MNIIPLIIGINLLLGLLAFGGQLLSVLHRKLAEKIGLADRSADCDPFFITYEKGIALADIVVNWSLPLGCLLFFLHQPEWVYFALAGGGYYTYSFGLISFPRILLKKENAHVGKNITLQTTHIFALLWGLSGLSMIILAIYALETGNHYLTF